jgi:hypothetical protein
MRPHRHNSRAVCGAHLALRGEILHMLELRRQLQTRADASGKGGKRKQGGDGGRNDGKRQRTNKRANQYE